MGGGGWGVGVGRSVRNINVCFDFLYIFRNILRRVERDMIKRNLVAHGDAREEK